MMETLILAGLSGLGTCAVAFALVKRSAPITAKDAKMIWMIHRENSSCGSHRWKPLRRSKDKIVGFQCECGYTYTQKKPLVCVSPRAN